MRRIIAVVLCCVLCIVLLSGCFFEKEEGSPMFQDGGRMVISKVINDFEYVVEDSETGILYYMVVYGRWCAITPLLDENGNTQSSREYK